jgi:hypothetical protein
MAVEGIDLPPVCRTGGFVGLGKHSLPHTAGASVVGKHGLPHTAAAHVVGKHALQRTAAAHVVGKHALPQTAAAQCCGKTRPPAYCCWSGAISMLSKPVRTLTCLPDCVIQAGPTLMLTRAVRPKT